MPDLITGEPEPNLPEKIGPYKIESLFSKGGMSLLYLGVHPETKQTLVIKVLSPSYVTHPQVAEQFLKEAEVIALTNHPNIVKLHGQGSWDKGLYIAMELIHGISLKQFITQHSLSLKRALEIIVQVAYALHHLHSHGVIHRDLKPENILITEEGEIKVIDFGIAQLHGDKPKTLMTSSFIGTPSYMSPEQKENPASVTFTTDIYSLGIILYELILGKLSYGLITLSGIPKKLKKIVAKMLAVSPMERTQNVSELIHDISHYMQAGDHEREKPGSDEIKEFYEEILKANLALSPLQLPEWPQIDLGVAKGRGQQQLGLYYDFFRLPNNTFLTLLASTLSSRISSAVSMGALRGMIRFHLSQTKSPFQLSAFVSLLNQMISEDNLFEPFALSCLLLDPFNDMMTYLSCGFSDLIHTPQGQRFPRRISSQNPLLGAFGSTELSQTSDNWNAGDTLVIHSLSTTKEQGPHQQEVLDLTLEEAAKEHQFLSAQRQAEAILKNLSSSSAYALIPFPKALITLQRII